MQNTKILRKILSVMLLTAIMACTLPISAVFAAFDDVTAVASTLENGEGLSRTDIVKIKFDTEVTFNDTDWTANVTVAEGTTPESFGSGANAVLDSETEKEITITLGSDHTVTVGALITFANGVVADKTNSAEVFDENVTLGGTFSPATINYVVEPSAATVTVSGYTSRPTELGVGTYSYSACYENYKDITSGSFEITEADLNTTKNVEITLEENDAKYTELDIAIATATAINTADYTDETVEVFKTAFESAKNVSRTLKFDKQSVIDTALNELNAAISGLTSWKDVSFMAVAVADNAAVNYAKANKIYLVFSEPVETGADVCAQLSVKDSVESAQWVNDTVYELKLKENSGLINGSKISYTRNDAVKTKLGAVLKDVNDVEIFGNLEPAAEQVTATSMAATIVKTTAKPGVAAGDKIMVVFNAPVKNNPNELIFTTSESVNLNAVVLPGTDNTVYEITLTGTENISDSDKLTYGSIANVSLKGTFGTAVAPKALAAFAVDNDGSAKTENDNIVIVFDMPTNAAVNLSALPELGEGASAVWSDNNTKLTITIGKNALIANGGSIDISSIGIKDMYEMKDAVGGSLTINGSFGTVTAPKINSAYAIDNDNEATVFGDQIVITFDRPTNGAAIDLTKTGVVVNQAGTFGSSEAKWFDDNTKLVITLAENANIKTGVKIDLSNQGIMDIDNIVDANIVPVVVKGSFGSSIEPKITRAIAFTQNNKHIIRTFFNTEVKVKPDTTMDIYIVGYDMTSVTGKWVHNGISYYDIVLSDNHDELAQNSVVKFEGTLVDTKTGEMKLTDATAVISGGFEPDVDMNILSLTAYSKDGSGIAKKGDRLVLVLNSEATSATCNLGAFEQADSSNRIVWVYTLQNDNEVKIAQELAFTIQSKTNGKTYANMKAAIGGSFGYVAEPKILSATAYSKDGSGIAKEGDEIIVVFDSPVSGVTSSLGTVSSDDGIVWKITLGKTPTVTIGTQLTFSVKSVATNIEYNNLSAVLGGSFGYAVEPKILSATAYSKDGSGIAKEGDEIIVVFDSPVSGVTSSLGTVSSDDGIVWKITLGKTPTVTIGTQLTFSVKSAATNIEYNNLSAVLGGSFGYAVEPKILSATAYSKDGSGIAKKDDEIVVVFNTPVLYFNSALGKSTTEDNIIWTITLDENPKIEIGTEMKFTITSAATMKEYHDVPTILGGSFGNIIEPKILSVTAISNDGSGVAKKGDKIVVVFNTKVSVGKADAEAGYVYTYELTENDIATGDYKIGKEYSVNVWSAETGKKYSCTKTIGGSYGYSDVPEIKSVILAEKNKNEVITVIFDGAVDIYEADGTTKKLIQTETLKENNPHLGDANATWVDEFTMEITLGSDATTTDADTLNLMGLGIKSKKTGIALEDSKISGIEIAGTLVPVVKEITASGKKIIINFSARTNGAANISNLTSLLGTGAAADWSNYNKTLTITLGENYTITNGGYIVLNGMGIYDAFSGKYHVTGQYKITGSVDTDKLTVSKIVAQSTDKSQTTAKKGDTIVVKFNSATNLNGAMLNEILDSAAIDNIIEIEGGNEAALGTGYSGQWTAYDTLVITLGGEETKPAEEENGEPTVTGNDPAIAVGDTITVKGVAFANGEGLMDNAAIALGGSFNGREFVLTEGTITRTGANNTGDYRVSVKAENTLIAPNIVPTIVCVAYKGTNPVSVMRVNVDVESTIVPVFEFAQGFGITNAKIYVFDDVFGDINSSPNVLAETMEITGITEQ